MPTFKKYDIVYYKEDGPEYRYKVIDILGEARITGMLLIESCVSRIEIYADPNELDKLYLESISSRDELRADGIDFV